MAESLIFMAGLPGSGKTTRLSQMFQEGWLVFDDYKANAFADCSKFRDSRKFRALVHALRDGVSCVVADIDFCKSDSRLEAEEAVCEEVAGVTFAWHFFANDPLACDENIRSRNRPCLQKELENLNTLSASYCIPPHTIVFEVRRDAGRRQADKCL